LERKTSLDRFLEKVEIAENECWEWKGHIMPNGYGQFWINNKVTTAHRASYIIHFGDYDKSLDVCHSCNNRYCVNPNHLFIGTRKDNMQHAVRCDRTAHNKELSNAVKNGKKRKSLDTDEIKDLSRCGSKNSSAKLNEQDVLSILNLWDLGYRQSDINIHFPNISKRTIENIIQGLNWKHVNRKDNHGTRL